MLWIRKKKQKIEEGLVMMASLLPVGCVIGLLPKRKDNFVYKGLHFVLVIGFIAALSDADKTIYVIAIEASIKVYIIILFRAVVCE